MYSGNNLPTFRTKTQLPYKGRKSKLQRNNSGMFGSLRSHVPADIKIPKHVLAQLYDIVSENNTDT